MVLVKPRFKPLPTKLYSLLFKANQQLQQSMLKSALHVVTLTTLQIDVRTGWLSKSPSSNSNNSSLSYSSKQPMPEPSTSMPARLRRITTWLMLLSHKRSSLSSSFEVEVATGRTIAVNSVLRDCTLELNNHIFPIDLIPMQLGSFDVIIGMDFLRENHAEVVCFEKMIRFSLVNGDLLCVYGETTSKGLKLMSYIQASKYLRKEYRAFLANIVVAEKGKKKKVEVKDVPVVRDFPQVFPDDLPGLPPSRDIDFRIDLIPGANPVAKAPYRLAPSEMRELSNQLQELLEKALFAQAPLLGARQSFLSKRRMDRSGCASTIGN
ncbi:putative aspartic peptidase domain superfamily, DNA/RNA polymerase superfamily [Helianthus annuus]|nr:putative aspartic peptidase domain superfamily, DNA/RNA polymerase superfamily [Helianthus annuus]